MTRYTAFVEDLHDHLCRDPNWCLLQGVDRRRGELPDRSPAETAATVANARELLRRLAAIDRGALSHHEQLDLDMAELLLSREEFDLTYTFNGDTQREQCPKAGDDLGTGLTTLLSNDPRPAAERIGDVIGRLERVPDFLDGVLSGLTTPVARWVAMDREAVGELPSLFATLQEWADASDFGDRERLSAACDGASRALADYSERLATLPTTTQLHIGEGQAARLVQLRGIDRPLGDLHRMAADFLAETGATIEELRGRLVEKHGLPPDTATAALQQHLARRYRVELPHGELDDVLSRYEREREKLRAFITERDLFPLPDDEDIAIERTPGYLTPTIPAGAMWAPAPFRAGTKRSLVHLTLSEELLDEHTELSIPGMMLHEGIPGHHLQLAWAAQHDSIVRKHYSGNEHHEGWTTYLEDYMLDVGYMGDLVDEARFIGKRDISRIGARVAIDLFFMTGDKGYLDVGVPCDLSSDDPFVAAGNLLAAVTGFVPGRVQAELNWYSTERGYPLSYLTGNRMLWELKERVVAANRGHLEGLDLDRAFHRTFLLAGNMPLAYMERVMSQAGLLGTGAA